MSRLFLASVVSIVLSLFCRSAAAEPIRLWHAYRDRELEALNAILARWAGPPVSAVAIPFDAYASKLAAAIPLGDGPDLYIDSHERLGDYRARKLVGPVGDALEKGAFSEEATDAVHLDGIPFAVPLSEKCVALYVNTDLVRTVPPDFEGIASLAGSLPPGVFPLAYEAQSTYAFAPLLSAFGGRLLDEHDGDAVHGLAAEHALDFTKALVSRKVVPEDADGALVTQLFGAGKTAFAISGPWLGASLANKPDLHYRVEKLPVLRATGAPLRPLLTVESVMLSPNGARKPEVRALARFLAGHEASILRSGFTPSPTARIDLPAPTGDLRAFSEQARTSVVMPKSRAMRALWDPTSRAIRKVLHGDASSHDALDEGRRRFDDVRRPLPGRASPIPAILVLSVLGILATLRWIRLARDASFRRDLRRSLPAYAYVTHAIVAVGLLVLVPLVIGAGTSLFAGSDEARRYVGLGNFASILMARGGPLLSSGSFYLVLLVTVLWTVCNVALHVGIGVVLALILSRPTLRMRALYRVLLIIPWAVPSYVTALAWKGMFHRQFGAVTGLILAINHLLGTSLTPIAWFSSFATAFSANLITNVWLGFPFMMVVTLGALTAVPDDVIEAATVDGATRFQRLTRVILPMIRPTLLPAVTLGAIWTFNMFNVVFLVSGGDPDGRTDILVSEAYRWAFTRENQYGYAAAYAVLIFLLLFTVTRLGKKRSSSVPEAA